MTTPEQDELIERWCRALESGEYDQSSGRLKNKNGYCCLGVLCEVAGIKPEIYQSETPGLFSYEGEAYGLPRSVMQTIGINTKFGRFTGVHPETKTEEVIDLTILNDYGTDFSAIAALIRSRPTGLFVEKNDA